MAHAVTASDEHDPGWQATTREALRMDLPYRLHSVDLDTAVADYLDHHGELVQLMADVGDGEGHDSDDPACCARQLLHRHLLVITLLLERVDACEQKRAERIWAEANPERRVAAAG